MCTYKVKGISPRLVVILRNQLAVAKSFNCLGNLTTHDKNAGEIALRVMKANNLSPTCDACGTALTSAFFSEDAPLELLKLAFIAFSDTRRLCIRSLIPLGIARV